MGAVQAGPRPLWVGYECDEFYHGRTVVGKVGELPVLANFEEIHQHPISRVERKSTRLGVKTATARRGFVGLETCTSLASLLLSCTFFDLFRAQGVTCDPASWLDVACR